MSTSPTPHGSLAGTDDARDPEPSCGPRRRRTARLATGLATMIVLPAMVSATVATSVAQPLPASPVAPVPLRRAAHVRNDFSQSSHSTCKMRLISRGGLHTVNCRRPVFIFDV